MKERPILFSAPMVRALLDGSKTQTRRAAKLTEAAHVKEQHGHRRWHPADPKAKLACPYGQPGDRLWVRESFDIIEGQTPGYVIGVDYRASHPECRPTSPTGERFQAGRDAWQWRMKDTHGMRKWKPSIHMPRTASRITLEITGVRVERLQDINRGDAMAEGCPFPNMAQGDDPRRWYADLWERINGPGSWDKNPWVWCVEFKRVTV